MVIFHCYVSSPEGISLRATIIEMDQLLENLVAGAIQCWPWMVEEGRINKENYCLNNRQQRNVTFRSECHKTQLIFGTRIESHRTGH